MGSKRANGEGAFRHRPDGRWEVRYYVIDPATGDRKRRSAYGKRRSDAAAAMNDVLDRVARGAPVKDATITVGDWIRRWVEDVLPTLGGSANYRDQRAGLARVHLYQGPFALIPLGKVTKSSVQAFLRELMDRRKMVRRKTDGVMEERPALSESTRRSIFLVLRSALAAAVEDGLIAVSPAASVPAPRVSKQQVVHLEAEDVVRLMQSLRSERLYVAYVFAVATACRRGETLALSWRNVNLETRVARVRTTLSAKTGGAVEGNVKSDGSFRDVIFPEAVAVMLRSWKAQQAAERIAAGAAWVNSGKVFTTPTGATVNPRGFLGTLQKHATKLDLPEHVGVHTLRHSAAVAMLEAGVHVRAVADSLGHSSAQITLDIYGYTADKVARAAADGLADVFGLNEPTRDVQPPEGKVIRLA